LLTMTRNKLVEINKDFFSLANFDQSNGSILTTSSTSSK